MKDESQVEAQVATGADEVTENEKAVIVAPEAEFTTDPSKQEESK